MTALRSRPQLPVGSSKWILEETKLANEFVVQEVEEFAFSARNEMEWLNEHMSDIFNRPNFDVAEAFKTPGKLRGKTPRTARKRDQTDSRAPLSNLFSKNSDANASPLRKHNHNKPAPRFEVAEDRADVQSFPTQSQSRFSFDAGKENIDSGYHDMTEDEMDIERPHADSILPSARSPPKPGLDLVIPEKPSNIGIMPSQPVHNQQQSHNLFVPTPNEVKDSKYTLEIVQRTNDHEQSHGSPESLRGQQQKPMMPATLLAHQPQQYSISASRTAAMDDTSSKTEHISPQRHSIDSEIATSSSENSSPRHSVVRKKSSLTFASLPAREPFATKKSVGTRPSQADPSRLNLPARDSEFGKAHSGNAISEAQVLDQTPADTGRNDPNALTRDDADTLTFNQVSDSTKKHNKTSTQRLQERFAMLGKPSISRTSKSISANAAASQMQVFHSLPKEQAKSLAENDQPHVENEGSWIATVQSKAPTEPPHAPSTICEGLEAPHALRSPTEKSSPQANQAVQPEPLEHHPETNIFQGAESSIAPKSLSYPELPSEPDNKSTFSETIWSEGPISASKAKLFSVLKSAKGIFASSASVSAQAKMEVLSSSTSDASRSKPHDVPPANADETSTLKASQPLHKVKKQSTQRSPERSQILSEPEAQERPVHGEVIPFEEANKVMLLNEESVACGHPEAEDAEQEVDPPLPPQKQPSSVSQMQKNGELRRPNRVGKEPTQKSRPAPVSIRLASQKIGHIGQSNTNASSSQQEQGPPVPPKQPMISKKASNSSLQTVSSTQSFKTAASATSSRPKALEAAARKKEQDEKEAQRKAEQKREMEKRRAAKAEEERRAAQEQKLADQRALEARQQAQKQALEQRKADAIRRAEQQKAQAAAAAATAARNKALEEQKNLAQNERQQNGPKPSRDEPATIRPVSRMGTDQDLPNPVPHVNPAKPPKRQFNPDAYGDEIKKPLPARPDAESSKRRKTSQDSFIEVVSRPAMAPPVRPSMMRKDAPSKPVNGFQNNSNTAYAGTTKGTLQNLSVQNPKTPYMNDLAKYSNARIPFAETPNPPPSSHMLPQGQQQVQQNQLQRPHHLTKAPATTAGNIAAAASYKSSPQYPHGDSIELPDIATESEESDDDNDFEAPSWAQSPALRELLKDQQLVDPAGVFGPIGPLMMEEVFKGNKERLARFRNRTSSANWNGPDRLTEEERRKDREAREKLERDGAWTFNTST